MKTCTLLFEILLAVARILASPGDLDPTFGIGGRVPPNDASKIFEAFGLAIQPDRRILVAGTERDFPNVIPLGLKNLVLTRYLPDGSFDLTFGTGGRVITGLSAACHSLGDDLALQPDGKIVVTAHLTGCGSETGAYVLRYLPDGSLDPAFDEDGRLPILSPLTGFRTTSCRVAAQSDGKLVLSCGEWMWEEDFWKVILRLNSNGSLDPTFGGGIGGPGRAYLGANDSSPFDIAIQTDGKIVAATEINLTIGQSVALTRLNTDGRVDASFGNSGSVFTHGGGFDLDVQALAIQPDNKVVIAGRYQSAPSTTGGHVIRYQPNGLLDTSFGSSGIVLNSPGSACYSSLAIQSNGRILAATDSEYRVTRFLGSGVPDPAFGAGGQVLISFPDPWGGFNDSGGISDVAIQPDGKIISSGYWQGDQPWPDVSLLFQYPAIARFIGDFAAAEVSIGGRVTTSGGRGIGNARVTMSDPYGGGRTTITSAFGYFRFDNVTIGQSYDVGARSKLYSFQPRTIQVSEELTNVNFIPL